MRLKGVPDSTCVEIEAQVPAVGSLRLWVPEGIATNTGISAVYPVGQWRQQGGKLVQRIPHEDSCGLGNFPKIDENTFECAGIRIPADSPVEWETDVGVGGRSVSFRIRLTNLGRQRLHKAGAAICLRFLNAPWWSDAATFVPSGGKLTPLADLGMEAGMPNSFQAYLVKGESYDNVFYREFWGFNRHRLDRPVMVSANSAADVCVGIQSDRAYFLHCNRGNPCTDIMLAFGDVEPAATAVAEGVVWIREGSPEDLLSGAGLPA